MEHCLAGRGAGRLAVARAARKAGRPVAPMEHCLDGRMVAEMEGCLAGRTSVPMAGCSAARLARFSLKGSLTAENAVSVEIEGCVGELEILLGCNVGQLETDGFM